MAATAGSLHDVVSEMGLVPNPSDPPEAGQPPTIAVGGGGATAVFLPRPQPLTRAWGVRKPALIQFGPDRTVPTDVLADEVGRRESIRTV